MVNLGRDIWSVLGDFNYVCPSVETIRGDDFVPIYSNIKCLEFCNFIFDIVLLDFHILDRSFNWYQPYCEKASRLVKFLFL